MSRYRTIHCKLWNDDKFPFVSTNCQLVFFHLLTTPLSTPFGFFKASINALCDEQRSLREGYREGFREGLTEGFFKYDNRAFLVLIPRYLRYNPPQSINVLRSWMGIYQELPSGNLNNEFLSILRLTCEGISKAFLDAFENLWPCFSDSSPIQEQEQEQEQNTMLGDTGDRSKIPKEPKFREETAQIISYLNEKSGKSFKATSVPAMENISGRMREGYSVEDFKTVIDNKVKDWKGTEHEKFIRPGTLFIPRHFDEYLNQNPRPNGNREEQKREVWLPDVSGAYSDDGREDTTSAN
jgi:uncharacterized phage protein (TIGR02220 family)